VKFFSTPLRWDGSNGLEKVGECDLQMDNASLAFSVLLMPFMLGMWKVHD
jgi:hypothetical protein